MRKKILNFTAIAAILLFGACSNQDEVLTDNNTDNNNEPTRTLSLTAAMPEAEPQTRVDLTRDGKDINLEWVVGDEIELVFVHDEGPDGIIKTQATASVSNVSQNGRYATFTIPMPPGITAPTFDLYGVYGGQGFKGEGYDEAYVQLPGLPGSATSLDSGANSLQSRKDVMLYFSSKDLNEADLQADVNFKHLGSVFALTLNNIDDDAILTMQESGITEARLVGVDPGNENWAYNSANCGQDFDLVNEVFLKQSTANNYISFALTFQTADVNENGEITLYGWYPMTEIVWPDLQLQIIDSTGESVIVSTNTKESRPTPPEAGKTYHFYASNASGLLYFTNEAFEPIPNP